MKFKVTRTDGTDNSGKKYLVVNIDESYAGKVADMIEAEERRRGTWEHGDKTMWEVMGIDVIGNKKIFRLNEDGVAEWIIAESKYQAVEFAAGVWGIRTLCEYFMEYLKDNPGETYDDFVDYFAIEEPMDKDFTIIMENGDKVTKKVSHWLGDEACPSYLGAQDY